MLSAFVCTLVSLVGSTTFSSWNAPLNGPYASDALSETLLSDSGTHTAYLASWVTGDRSTPHVNNANWEQWSPDTNGDFAGQGYHTGDSAYMFETEYPSWAKHDGGAQGLGKHPSTGQDLTGAQAEMYVHPPYISAQGVVVRFTVPLTGNYMLLGEADTNSKY